MILLPEIYPEQTYKNVPYYYGWKALLEVKPENLYGMDKEEFITILKEALTAWGGGYNSNTEWATNYIVEFNF